VYSYLVTWLLGRPNGLGIASQQPDRVLVTRMTQHLARFAPLDEAAVMQPEHPVADRAGADQVVADVEQAEAAMAVQVRERAPRRERAGALAQVREAAARARQ
jgi:hypothetical protein